jgi:hypothetical protein
MSTPANPLQGFDPAALMQQSQQTLQSPMAQTVPQGGGQIDPTQHPVIAALIRALSQGAQSYGWTAMQPAERLQRQELEQKKAETLGSLASTSAYREGELSNKATLAAIAQQNAETKSKAEQSEAENREFNQTINQRKVTLAENQNTWRQAIAQGHLDQAHAALDLRAKDFEKTFSVMVDKVGIDRAKLALGEEANQIRAGMVDVARQSLSQRGTMEGAQLQEKVGSWDKEHWILSSLFGGLGDISSMNQNTANAPTPGVAPMAPVPPQNPLGIPTVPPKVGAKQKQQGGGAPQSSTKPAYQKDGKWYDAATNTPLP